MEKRIIKNGDIVCIDSLALQPAEIIVDELGHKTFKVDNELELKNKDGAILGATLIFKYEGAGKFEEMITNKIYLSDGFVECIEYGVEDPESISFVDNKQYISMEEFQKDFYELSENPTVISTKASYIYELDDKSKSLYVSNNDDFRLETISAIEEVCKNFFDKSVENMIEKDAEFAALENKIHDFRHR